MEAINWAADLQKMGLLRGDQVVVHSSLRQLGNSHQKAWRLFEALTKVLGPEGMLLVPTLSYTYVTPASPVFDRRHTPSSVGGFSNFCLQIKEGVRSLHPTHSIWMYGPDAQSWASEHAKDSTPVGSHSPLSRLKETGGKILMLGCGLRPNTSMHGVEELHEPPYLFGEKCQFSLVDKERQWKSRYRLHDFKGYIQRYDRMKEHLPPESYVEGRVGQAQAYLLDVRAVWEAGLKLLRQDPFALVERK
ncbi:MAG: AAC(3) family N-acetyltransferase [Bacteroidota bacterium]